jgi:hypothetical protein
MDYQLDIISHDQIPSNVYFHNKNENYQYIHKYNFSNGLTFIIGSNKYSSPPTYIIEPLQFTIDIVLKYTETAYELQLYYQDYLGIFNSYKDCTKIFDYYTNNEHLIREVIEYYSNYNNYDYYDDDDDEGVEEDYDF